MLEVHNRQNNIYKRTKLEYSHFPIQNSYNVSFGYKNNHRSVE